jgi:putative ABC transport system permease protein
MPLSIFRIVRSSIKFYIKPVLYQVLIIALLSAVITGSLLTGHSVRISLKKSASERLGNTGILISSGLRYFDAGLVQRLQENTGLKTTGFLEIAGSSQGLTNQKVAFNTNIYAISSDFFPFHGTDSVSIKSGEVAINSKLAVQLEVKTGDDIIIRFNQPSDIPADAPFAPATVEGKSVVMKIGKIIGSELTGNFSLSISQIVPMNIFINWSDLEGESIKSHRINRLLVGKNSSASTYKVKSALKSVLRPSDVGLRVREIKKTGQFEIISDRIFIDEAVVKEIENKLPSSAPVLTYLGNRINSGSLSTPYSFVAALPPSIYPEIATGNGIIINRWLADDLSVTDGDTVQLFWYSPDSLNNLVEKTNAFVVKKVVEFQGIWADSLLMPDFPGIAGSESCSDWDAGVPIKMDQIRDKDEAYWNKYKGSPKAFISYEKGKEIWGNNFGPATAIRLPAGISGQQIIASLEGTLDPGLTGLIINDLYGDSIKAADESVDFGTLFLSLGFFLILASFVLLSFAVTYYFDSKRGQINTLYAIGFTNRRIKNILFLESSLIGIIGCFTGAIAGYVVNIIITIALNSVWTGAVQTNTLEAYFSIVPIITGFAVTIFIMMIFMIIKTNKYLKSLNLKEKVYHSFASASRNLLVLITSAVITLTLFILSLTLTNQDIILSFGAGTMLLATLILSWRQFYIAKPGKNSAILKHEMGLSGLYYSFNSSHAVTPILFIAAGIFAVLITGINRMDFDEKHLERSSGTGGYLLWCESNISIKEDLNTVRGRSSLGFDGDSLSGMNFTQIKRSSGNDASCLNLNHISSPPLLGIDADDFIKREAFSFSKVIPSDNISNKWQLLSTDTGINTIYGIADQTVLDWGLKISVGDTLILRAENGQPLNIIIAAGLQSSVFQGYLIIGKENFTKYFPSVSGSSILLVDGNPDLTELYKKTLNERLSNYGVNTERTNERLASFYEVTNTYLSVFGVFGALGMITGIAGLGLVLLRNYNQRKKEFAVMLATGFSFRRIRRIILKEQVLILFAGLTSGLISAVIATLPSIRGSMDIPWYYLLLMITVVALTGLTAIIISVRSISGNELIYSLKKE